MSLHPFFKGFLKISFKFLLIKSKKNFTVILSKNESAGAKKIEGGAKRHPPACLVLRPVAFLKCIFLGLQKKYQ